MKRARIAWAGAVHDAIERDGRLELLTPAFKNRLLDFGDVVWLPPLAPMPPHRPLRASPRARSGPHRAAAERERGRRAALARLDGFRRF